MIRTTELTKRFARVLAVDDVSLNIPPGEIYGFLGPNGAGKTTTIMMLLGITEPTSGHIELFGESYTPNRLDLRRRIGVVPEKHPRGVWTWMTGNEYLSYFADLFGMDRPADRIMTLLEQVGLTDAAGRKIAGYSRGMLQKLSICRALLHDPDILFLDEPISGLDPLGIKQVRDLIMAENREGRTIFISSHLLSEVEKICDRVAIIFRGKLLAEDTMSSLLTRFVADREIHIDVEEPKPELAQKLGALSFVNHAELRGNTLVLKVPSEGDFRSVISREITSLGAVLLGLREKEMSLEEAFVTITQENLALFTKEGSRDE